METAKAGARPAFKLRSEMKSAYLQLSICFNAAEIPASE
jgi:hypothetical protein